LAFGDTKEAFKVNEKKYFLTLAKGELEGAALYEKVAGFVKKESDRETLLAIAREEQSHAKTFASYAGQTPAINRFRVGWYAFLARTLGYTFTLKLLENGEDKSIKNYQEPLKAVPEMPAFLAEEKRHEDQLVEILDEERLKYVGDIVLGMNDALVELTGALAGYTLAMRNTGMIAMAGLITGISATLSMASSGFLSAREAGEKDAVKSSIYTGVAYLITVAILIAPYLIAPQNGYFGALVAMLLLALMIIAGFNFYVAVAKGRSFRRGFLGMAAISMGVAAICFGVGIVVKNVLGINL
jgi:VIT1/CCC1 family predicted Fe2+/Mn2+ transporter